MKTKSQPSASLKERRFTPDSFQTLLQFATALIVLISAVMSLLAGFYASPGPKTTDFISSLQQFSFLVLGLGVFATVIVLIAILLKRKARNVILLKNQLAAIYLAALKESALNPHRQQNRSARLSPTFTIQE
jgi:hypothetical protein